MKYLFLPGMLTDKSLWQGLINLLNFPEKDIIHPDVYSYDTFGEIIDNIIKNNPNEKFLCFGMSMGGYICLELLHKYPLNVCGLVIMNSGARVSTEENIIKRNRLISLVEASDKFVGINDVLIDDMLSLENKNNIDIRNHLKKMTLSFDKKVFISQQKAIIKRMNAIEELKGNDAPMLLIAGGQDNITPSYLLEEFSSAVNNANYICYDDCGHVIPLEKCERLAKDVRDFMKLNNLTISV